MSEEHHHKYHLLTKPETPIWFDVRKPIRFDESTARVRYLEYAAASGQNVAQLNQSGEIRFDYNPGSNQVIHLADKHTGLRFRFKMATGYTGIRNPGNAGPTWGTNNANSARNGDVTLEGAWFGYLFKQIQFLIGGQDMETIYNFPIWFQLMCHLQPLDFKLKEGCQMGFYPDKTTGLADDSKSLWLPIASAVAVNAQAVGNFYVYAQNTTGAVTVANAGTMAYTIPGSNITLTLVPQAVIQPNASGLWFIQYTSALAVNAGTNTLMQLPNSCIQLQLTNSTAGNFNAATASPYTISYTNPAPGAAPNNIPIQPNAVIKFPLNGTNTNYETAYYNRKLEYNYPNASDGTEREFEIVVPLYYLFGLCQHFNRLMSNMSFNIKMLRDPTSYDEFFGQPGYDGDLKIQLATLIVTEVVPEDEYKEAFNRAIEHNIEIGYLTPRIEFYSITTANINFFVPYGSYKPDYVFVIFKDGTVPATGTSPATTAQANSLLNIHADIQNLQVNFSGEMYPNLPQLADFRTNKYSKFYEDFRDICCKITGECSVDMKEFRDLYPIFAFDLTAQAQKIKFGGANQINIQGQRNSNYTLTATVNMYVVVLYEKYFEANYLNNRLITKT